MTRLNFSTITEKLVLTPQIIFVAVPETFEACKYPFCSLMMASRHQIKHKHSCISVANIALIFPHWHILGVSLIFYSVSKRSLTYFLLDWEHLIQLLNKAWAFRSSKLSCYLSDTHPLFHRDPQALFQCSCKMNLSLSNFNFMTVQ